MTKPLSSSTKKTDTAKAIQQFMRQPFRDPQSTSDRIGWLLIGVIVGALAGFVGGIVGAALIPPVAVVDDALVRYVATVSTSSSTVADVSSVVEATVDVFADGAGADPSTLALDQRSGRGVFLTSDGWLVTTTGVLGDDEADLSPMIVTYDRTVHAVDRIARDPVTSLVFMHVSNVNSAVVPFREADTLRIGESVGSPSVDHGIASTALQSNVGRLAVSAPESSEVIRARVTLRDAIDVPLGSPLVDGGGSMVGLLVSPRFAYDMTAVLGALPSLFSDGTIARNALGIRYRDLSQFGRASSSSPSGVIVSGDARNPAIRTGSAADGVFDDGDVILAIDDVQLSELQSLPEQLQEYPLGATVPFRVRRGDQELLREVAVDVLRGGARILNSVDDSQEVAE
jgi:S1-C subfamily serine protease